MWRRKKGGRLVRSNGAITAGQAATSTGPKAPCDYRANKRIKATKHGEPQTNELHVELHAIAAPRVLPVVTTLPPPPSFPHTACEILEYLDEVDILLGFMLVDRERRHESRNARCWNNVNVFRWPANLTFNYLLFIGRLRVPLRSLKVRIARKEMFVLQWLLRACGTSVLTHIELDIQLIGHYTLQPLSPGLEIDMTGGFFFETLFDTAFSILEEEGSVPVQDPAVQIDELELLAECSKLEVLKVSFVNVRHSEIHFTREQVMSLASLSHLSTLRINSLHALELVKRSPQITDLTLFGSLASRGHKIIDIDLPFLRRLDFSHVNKGLWIQELCSPNLEVFVLSRQSTYGSRSFYGSGFAISGASDNDSYPFKRQIDDLSLPELLGQMMYNQQDDAMTPWAPVHAVVSDNFRIILS